MRKMYEAKTILNALENVKSNNTVGGDTVIFNIMNLQVENVGKKLVENYIMYYLPTRRK